ncbi:MAG: peptidoglycan-binding domain-containing protein [Candidatus Roizmanbacteria bacterium]|nr:peptidoglycan-binding domain-containing protein [Candidatus Roizmanbacteria bacterium]
MKKTIRDWRTPFVIWVGCVFVFSLLAFIVNYFPNFSKLASWFIGFPVLIGIVSFMIFFLVGSVTLIENIRKTIKLKYPSLHIDPWSIVLVFIIITIGYIFIQSQPQLVMAMLEKLPISSQTVNSIIERISIQPTPIPIPTEIQKNTLLTQDLNVGVSGDDVRILQAAFTESGLLSKSLVTGYFGNQTSNAVKTFQQVHKLALTGYVDSNTRDEFNNSFGTKTRDYYLSLIPKVVYTAPVNTNSNITNTTDSDPQVNCGISSSCGGGTKLMKLSTCNNTICCEVVNQWIFMYSLTDCQNAQRNAHANTANTNQGNVPLNSGSVKIKCSYSSGEYQFDFGDLTYDECTIKSNEYWASKRQAITNNSTTNNYSPPVNTNTAPQMTKSQCQSAARDKWRSQMTTRGCYYPCPDSGSCGGSSVCEAMWSIAQGDMNSCNQYPYFVIGN